MDIIRGYHQIYNDPRHSYIEPYWKGNSCQFPMRFKLLQIGSGIGPQHQWNNSYRQNNMRDQYKIIDSFDPSFPSKGGGIRGHMIGHIHDQESQG